jgi:hypothetical protein
MSANLGGNAAPCIGPFVLIHYKALSELFPLHEVFIARLKHSVAGTSKTHASHRFEPRSDTYPAQRSGNAEPI